MTAAAKLSPRQAAVLHDMANVSPEDSAFGPFLPLNTIGALVRKGFVEVRKIKREPGMPAMLASMGCSEPVITDEGRSALAAHKGELQ